MAVSVSKVDALMEMVRAFDDRDFKRSNKIGKILSKTIQNESESLLYSQYIQLDKETKKLFPIKIRKYKMKKIIEKEVGVKVITKECTYEIICNNGMRIVELRDIQKNNLI